MNVYELRPESQLILIIIFVKMFSIIQKHLSKTIVTVFHLYVYLFIFIFCGKFSDLYGPASEFSLGRRC